MEKPDRALSPWRRLVVSLVVGLVMGVLSATATADPGGSPVFEKLEIPFVLTASDGAFNPCVGDDPDYELSGLIEIFFHGSDRPNGFHSNELWWVSATDNHGFVLPRMPVGPDVWNINDNNGVVTLASTGHFRWHHPETKQRSIFHASFHFTDVGGANIVTIERLKQSDCLGPKANGA